MKIDILYIEGCPNHKPASERVRAVLRDAGISADVNEIEIADEAAAKKFGFPGSPTIRVDGVDVDPAMRGAQTGRVACRYYSDKLPPAEMIRAALYEAEGRRE